MLAESREIFKSTGFTSTGGVPLDMYACVMCHSIRTYIVCVWHAVSMIERYLCLVDVVTITVSYNTLLCDVVRHATTLYGMVRYDMVWYGICMV